MAKAKQLVLYLDESGDIKRKKGTIETASIIFEKEGQAWHLVHDLLIQFPQLGYLVALVSPRTDIPLSPFRKLKPKEEERVRNIEDIAEKNIQNRDVMAARMHNKNITSQVLMIAIIGVVICFLVVGVMAMFPKSGIAHMFGK